jgi:hypothetical protein
MSGVFKLNWRLIVVHCIAVVFAFSAFQALAYLKDFSFLNSISLKKLSLAKVDPNRLTIDVYWMWLSELIGLILALSISLFTIVKNHLGLINALLVILLSILLVRLQNFFIQYNPVFYINYQLGFKVSALYLFIVSITLLFFALFLFLWKPLIAFIINANLRHQSAVIIKS